MIEEANLDNGPQQTQDPPQGNLDTQQTQDPPLGGPPTDPPPVEEGTPQSVVQGKSPNDIVREITGQPDQLAEPVMVSPNTLVQEASGATAMKSLPADGTTGTVASVPDPNPAVASAKPVVVGMKPNAAINQSPLPANPPKLG